MKKIKYYYKDENGNEVLARTSSNEYHYYCFGKCSMNINNVDSEKKYYEKRALEDIEWCKINCPERIEEATDRYYKISNEKIYELYTK